MATKQVQAVGGVVPREPQKDLEQGRQDELDVAAQEFRAALAEEFSRWVPAIVKIRLEVNKDRSSERTRFRNNGIPALKATELVRHHLSSVRLWPRVDTDALRFDPQGVGRLDEARLRIHIALLMGEVGKALIDAGIEPRTQVSSPAGVAPRRTFGPRGSQAWQTGSVLEQEVSWLGVVLWSTKMQQAVDKYNEIVLAAPDIAEATDRGSDDSEEATGARPGNDDNAQDTHDAPGDRDHAADQHAPNE